jgi:glycerol dehydrogenase-like iron-containing ADH family enzyme
VSKVATEFLNHALILACLLHSYASSISKMLCLNHSSTVSTAARISASLAVALIGPNNSRSGAAHMIEQCLYDFEANATMLEVGSVGSP